VNMSEHGGVHPCVGALDVLPIIPMEGATLAQARDLAEHLGKVFWSEFGLPSLFYEYKTQKNTLANFRKRGFAGLSECEFDVGDVPHPTAGAVAISARELMIAFNVNLLGGDLALAKKIARQIAKKIARQIRESSGGLVGVKALGLYLPKQKKVQVSMNITDYRTTSPLMVYKRIASLVQGLGVGLSSELIGLMPKDALASEDYATLGLKPEDVKTI